MFRSPGDNQCEDENQARWNLSKKGGGRERTLYVDKYSKGAYAFAGLPIASAKTPTGKWRCILFGGMDTASLSTARQIDAIHFASGGLHLRKNNLIRWA